MAITQSKNTSPKQLAALNAIIISIVVAILAFVWQPLWYVPLLSFVGVFVFTFLLFYATLQRFIYRKIKLIYKFIYDTKATKKEEFFNKNILQPKTIEEVSEDVVAWAAAKKAKIEALQNNEEYRKEFLTSLAHELRTPIFTVQGYVHTLLGGAIDDPKVNKQFLNNAAKGIERLAQLAEDLNQISNLESGQTLINASDFIIQDLVKDVYAELSMKANEKNLNLEFKRGTEMPITVNADKDKIKQVVVNIVENAIKYCGNDCTITTGCYVVDEGHVYIEISDNGPGISEEHLPRIFERFYRADRNKSREIGGTGLGLSIVKHIIEAHNHTVNVRSKPDVGSSFGFTLDKG